jgi:uncharacterized phage protein (TIGR02216 family)
VFSAAAYRLAGLAGAILGWRPDEFWGATPSELATVLAAMAGDVATPVSSGELRRLMEMFPDG